MTPSPEDIKKLAAIAYGEASTTDNPLEIQGIAWAVANRARAWQEKTLDELLNADPNYTYAVKDGNKRFQRLLHSTEDDIKKDQGMSLAMKAASDALNNTGLDPSNGAYWWDGIDFKTNHKNHPKAKNGFKFGDSSHNIFQVEEKKNHVTIYWQRKNKKTGKIEETSVRGEYDYVWVSTAAHGSTIFWTHDPDYLRATGGKAYK